MGTRSQSLAGVQRLETVLPRVRVRRRRRRQRRRRRRQRRRGAAPAARGRRRGAGVVGAHGGRCEALDRVGVAATVVVESVPNSEQIYVDKHLIRLAKQNVRTTKLLDTTGHVYMLGPKSSDLWRCVSSVRMDLHASRMHASALLTDMGTHGRAEARGRLPGPAMGPSSSLSQAAWALAAATVAGLSLLHR